MCGVVSSGRHCNGKLLGITSQLEMIHCSVSPDMKQFEFVCLEEEEYSLTFDGCTVVIGYCYYHLVTNIGIVTTHQP